MDRDWEIQVEDGAHAVHAEISLSGWLKVTWDGAVIVSSRLWWLLGDLKSFQRNGHSFRLRVRGIGRLGALVLFMDGVEVPRRSGLAPVKPAWAEMRSIAWRSGMAAGVLVAAALVLLDLWINHRSVGAWGAVAVGISGANSVSAAVVGKRSEADARSAALQACRTAKGGAEDARSLCAVVDAFVHQCVATVGPKWAIAANEQEARDEALAKFCSPAAPLLRGACAYVTATCQPKSVLRRIRDWWAKVGWTPILTRR